MKSRNVVALLLACCAVSTAGAQSFGWKSRLDTVGQNGFYTLVLSADWLARLNPDLSDIRIRDGAGHDVPFVVKQHPSLQRNAFVSFPLLRTTVDSAFTTLELDAPSHFGTDQLNLVLGNTAVERRAVLSGSDDRRQWFVIDENLWLKNAVVAHEDRFVQTLQIPFIRYRYLKLKIENAGTDPLRVTKAGVYADTAAKDALETDSRDAVIVRQTDSSDGGSYVWIRQAAPYPVDKISLVINGPKFFSRDIAVYKADGASPAEFVTTATLRAGTTPEFWLTPVKMQTFLLRIANGDNPPLHIAKVTTQCRRRQLIAYLEKGRHYVLVGGDAGAVAPDYDLAQFRDSIPRDLPVLQTGTPEPLAVVAAKQKGPGRAWLWPSIIAGVLLLSILTLQLLREMKRRPD